MTDLPRCRLCQCAPLTESEALVPWKHVLHPYNKCHADALGPIPETVWTALMGDQIQAIANKVCRDIPNRFTVCIVLEKDAGYVELWRGNHERFELDCDGGIEDQIENAMAVAMGEQQ